MENIEKMKKYIARTLQKNSDRYQMKLTETMDLVEAAKETPLDIIWLAYAYGMAKGYRAARAEVRR